MKYLLIIFLSFSLFARDNSFPKRMQNQIETINKDLGKCVYEIHLKKLQKDGINADECHAKALEILNDDKKLNDIKARHETEFEWTYYNRKDLD